MQNAPVVELDTIAPSDGAGLGSSPSGRTSAKNPVITTGFFHFKS